MSHKPSENPLGKRSAGNLHAAFDEAEAGNVTTIETEIAAAEFAVKLGHTIESARQLSTLLTRHDLLQPDNLPQNLNDNNIKKALAVLDVMNFSPLEREAYEDHLKWLRIEASTLKKAEAKGVAKGIEQIAINMLKQNLDNSLISSVTGLSTDDILKLKSKL